MLFRFVTNIISTLLLMVLVAGIVSSVSAQNSIGRLFTSASERASLDQLRKSDIVQDHGVQKPKEKKVEVPHEPVVDVLLNGVVKRSSGKQTIWINGQQVKDGKGPDKIRVSSGPNRDNRITVKIAGKPDVYLKPGQRLNSGTGEIQENYQLDSVSDSKGDKGD